MKIVRLLVSILLLFIAGCASFGGAQKYYDSGKEQFIEGDFEVAIEKLSKAIEIDPTNHLAYLKRGTAYSWQENYEAAIKDFIKAIEVTQEYEADGYNALAFLYATCSKEEFRDGEKALLYAQKVVSFHRNPWTYDTLAAAYAENNDFKNAILYQKMSNEGLADRGKYEELAIHKMHLERYENNKPWRDNIARCPRN